MRAAKTYMDDMPGCREAVDRAVAAVRAQSGMEIWPADVVLCKSLLDIKTCLHHAAHRFNRDGQLSN